MRHFWGILFAVVLLAAFVLTVVSPFVGWWLPRGASTYSGHIDALYYWILGVTGFRAIGLEDGSEVVKGLMFPLVVMAIGLVASRVGIFFVRARSGESNALKPINRGIYVAQVRAIIGAAVLAFVYVGDPDGATVSHPGARLFGAIVAGVALGFAASRITQYFTSTETAPVHEIAEASHAHPTLAEAVKEAALSALGRALNI